MSIAVAAVIRTPVCLRLLQAVLGLCALLAAWPLSGLWRSLPASGQLVGGYALGWSGALLSAAGGVFLLALLRRRRKPQALDISPVGQLRLAVYLEHGAAPDAGAAGQAQPAGPGPVAAPGLRLLPGSTLWPSLLVLCLADAAGRRTAVLVQRGGSCTAFRPLAVACRAIAARNREE
ncbi:hypothetical protein [Janthinobacterium sp. 13]|uniref:hypothetical protein n=1 Tax=Janthinobacterium sp. 13 TaxID=2035211 RepID=UPI000C16886D|nr:hypothetical protein [Janthinobacterium sp. 13]PIF12465.1 hypothetical protein CLU94_4548 [Janthinobacterium sp. 13]